MKDAILVRRIPSSIGAPFSCALVPADDRAAEALGKIPAGEDVAVQVKRGRSVKQLRTYWAVLDYVSHSTEWTPERLHVALKIKLGFYDLCELANGRVVPVPHTTAFDTMPHAEFCDYMNKAVALICDTVLDGYDSERLIAEAQSALGIRPLSTDTKP